MRLAAVWLLSTIVFTSPCFGDEAISFPSFRRPVSATAPKPLADDLLRAAESGKLRCPAPLLVQDVDQQGRVRILREVFRAADGRYINAGRFREVDLQQRLVREGRYANGLRSGPWVQIHREPLPALFKEKPYAAFTAPFYSEADFLDGQLHGAWRIYDANRRLVSEIHFAQGQRHGFARWLHPGGATMREVLFRQGSPHGAMRVLDERGELISREDFDAGRRLYAETEFYGDNDSPQSAGFFLDGHLRAVTPDNWDRCEFARFHRSGKPAKHGVYTKWHSSGAKAMQGEFVEGRPEGEFSWWYESGAPRTTGAFRMGEPDGVWRWWRDDGTLQMEGEYGGGKPLGQWRFYDEDGELQQAAPKLLAPPDAVRIMEEAS